VQPIPLGVADDGRLAVLGTRNGQLVAIDPGDGTVRWRAGRGLRPCAVTAGAVVALRSLPPVPPEVVVLDVADGRELWTAPLPGPVPAPPGSRPSVELGCTLEDGGVLLRWATAMQYEGGAAPSRQVLEQSTHRAAGAVHIDLRARTVQAADAVDGEEAFSAAVPTSVPTAAPVLAPDVVQHGQLGDLRLELAVPPGTSQVVLRAVDPASNAQVWQVVVEEQAPRRPPPLRP
jgi:outer membrane protein assembly factor BamB